MTEHGKLPSVMETSYEVPHHMDLQHQDGKKTVEQGPSPSTTATSANLFNTMKTAPTLDSSSEASYATAHGDICTNISPTPTYEEIPQFPCEESHHHMSDMSDSTIRDIESISYDRMSVTTTSPTHESMPHILCEVERYLSDSTNHMSESILEGGSEPQHLVSEVVDTACEATMISNDSPSTPSVFSPLVLGLLHDDTPTIDESIPPMETKMAMMDDDAPPTWFDEHINTIVTLTAPAAIHTGPITRAHACQLNYQVLPFLGNDSNVHENIMLPKLHTFVLLTNEGPGTDKRDEHWSKTKHGDDVMHKGIKNGVTSDDFRTLKPP